ncbi:hypothetical protein Pcinc_043206, partial [Petrolisthes cinctipes]
VLTITSPDDQQTTTVTLGPIFEPLNQMEEIHITYSNVPAIGDLTFWGLVHLRLLNLTHNNITLILSSHLAGLEGLEALHLDHNHIGP